VIRDVVNSLKYVVGSLAISLPLGLALALALNRELPFIHAFRTIIIAPWVVSQTVAALLWVWLLDPAYGPIGYVLKSWLRLPGILFVGSPELAMPTLILANVWLSYPLATVLLLAALQTIPPDLYEAAQIDGCSSWKCFSSVTLPLLRSTLLSTAIMLTLQYFSMVTLIFVMTGGGPVGVTRVLALRVFLEGFVNYNVGYAAAIGMVIFLLNIVFSAAYIRILRTEGASG
jgi:ABC-type sugar transport system permease subunit